LIKFKEFMRRIILSVLLLSQTVTAQTGPAGVGTSASNVLWLKSDIGTFSDAGITAAVAAGSVQQWNDQSGNLKHAIQTTANLKPSLQNNIFNSQPALRFDGSNDCLLASAVTTANLASVFAIVRFSSLPSPNPGIIQASPTGLGFSTNAGDKSIGMWVNSTNSNIWGRGVQSNNTQCQILQNTALSVNNGYIINNRYDGANIRQYVNNGAAGTVAYNGTLKSWTDFGIGRQGTESWAGDISEIITYNVSLNEAQRIIVDNYLSAKYDITLAANDKYAGDNFGNGNYDYEVAGVGKDATGSNPSFSASISGGIGVSTTGIGFDNTDYILAGHATNTNSQVTTDVGGMTGTNNARWHRIWYVDITNTGTNIETNIEFDMSDGDVGVVALSTPTNYVLLYRAAQTGTWTELATANAITGDRVQFNNYSFVNDGYYTIGSKDYLVSPLPIELLSFNAIQNKDVVNIFWETASETNNDYYTVERSKDGIVFEPVSITKGSSKSLQNLEYAETDFNPLSGISYYRLKQTDLNGEFTYSKIVAVNYHFGDIGMDVYPNPNSGDFKISLTGIENKEVLVVVRDISGKECFSKIILTQDKDQIIAVDLSGTLKPGTYIVISSSFNKLYSKKIIVK